MSRLAGTLLVAICALFSSGACGSGADGGRPAATNLPSAGASASWAGPRPPAAPTDGAVGNSGAVSPLDNPLGILPGLASVPAAQQPAAIALIDQLSTKGRGPKTGYSRAKFGRSWSDNASAVPYAFNGCYTRDDILRRDLTDIQVRPGTNGCVVITGTLTDPYTGTVLRFSKDQAAEIQIDHVYPLSLAWQMGAWQWDDAKRLRFANDPLNLLAVDGRQNEVKSASGPASWLPPNKRIRCAYSVRFAQVTLAYQLAVPLPDKEMMLRQCS